MLSVSVVIISIAVFVAVVVNLAAKPVNSAKITTALMFISVIGGTIIYGTGYAQQTGDFFLSIVRTPLSVIRMFLGKNDFSAISDAKILSTQLSVTLFWFLQLIAFYTTASAAVIAVGATALRHLRCFISRKGNIVIIYGINENSIAVGSEYHTDKSMSVVFVDENPPSSFVSDINARGMTVFTGGTAAESHPSFLKKLHIKDRKVTVLALKSDTQKNLNYALQMRDSLEQLEIPSENTTLILPGTEDIFSAMLQVSDTQYGFGYINAFDPSDLVGRALLSVCPPWDSIAFNVDGTAKEDYECAVVGFGRYGQAVLKQLIMNGQFVGSQFHAAVFSVGVESENGLFNADCPEVFKNYNIQCHSADGRSSDFYEYIKTNMNSLKLIALCTGSDNMNREIADNLMLFLKRNEKEDIQVVICGKTAVEYQSKIGAPVVQKKIYTSNMLSAEKLDRAAIMLNSIYDKSHKTDWEKWISCDSFSKVSSRASVAFMPAFIKASGSSEETVNSDEWKPDDSMLQVLGEMEHLRWMAFHYAMGYKCMSEEEFQRRANVFLEAKKQGRTGNKRFTKDQNARIHACLVPWSQLDDLSVRVSNILGEAIDYKQSDINNVLALPQVLRLMKEETEKNEKVY